MPSTLIPAAALLILLASAAEAQPPNPVPAPGRVARWLADSIRTALAEEGLIGAMWGTLNTDGSVQTGAAGLANFETRERLIAGHHRMQVGSVTKTIIALGALRLVSEGRLSLDATVTELLPELKVDNRWAPKTPLRVRHLLDHTSGLDDAHLWQIFTLLPSADVPLRDAFARRAETITLRSEPGTRFSYSNQGYTLLGMIIERITSLRYEQYLDAHLLEPLGMTRSTLRFVSQASTFPDTTMAMGHFENGQPQPTVPLYLRPATQFTTTSDDMMRLAAFLMSDGTVHGVPFISTPLLEAMGTPVGTEAAKAGLTVGYGLGLGLRDRHGVLARCHPGNGIGNRAMFCIMPASKQAFFIAMNAEVETANYGRFDVMLLNALAVPRETAIPEAAVDADIDDWTGTYWPDPMRFMLSAYAEQLVGFARLVQSDTGLQFRPFLGVPVDLTPVGPHLYRAPGRRIASHVLLTSSDGRQVISDGTHSWVRATIWRLVPLWFSALVGIVGLVRLIVAAAVRVSRNAISPQDPGFAPTFALIALLVPLPFFFLQPFLAIGDLTLASALTALVTGALPLALMYGVFSNLRIGVRRTKAALYETYAMLALLQWTLVLAAWGLIPLRLWS